MVQHQTSIVNPLTMGHELPSSIANLEITPQFSLSDVEKTIGQILGSALPGVGGSIGTALGDTTGEAQSALIPGNFGGVQILPYNGDPGVVGTLGLVLLAGGLIMIGTLALVITPAANVATEAANDDPETHPIVVAYKGLRRKKKK